MSRTGLHLLIALTIVGTIACDRVTKHIAVTALADAPTRSLFADTVRLALVENTGGFLSLGASLPAGWRQVLFIGLTGLMLVAVTVVAFQWRHSRWPLVGAALFLAGGASNWIDRVARGSVVDFLNVGVGPLRTGIFNVADVAILAGAALMAIGQMRPVRGSVAAPATREGEQWSNAREDVIEVVPYDPTWPQRYEVEADAIRGSLRAAHVIDASGSSLDVQLEHAGSTAVPGLAAKPILDIYMTVQDRSQWPRLVAPLKGLGYVYRAENPDTDAMFFVKGMPPFGTGRTHHVHVRSPGRSDRELRFRDHLRAHPEVAAAYGALKTDLARRHRTDREAYTQAKSAFIDDTLTRIPPG